MKKCPICRKLKPLGSFYIYRDKYKDNIHIYRQTYCVECKKIEDRKWRENNYPKRRSSYRRWALKNPLKLISYRQKRQSIPQNSLNARIRWQIWKGLKKNKAGRHWETLVNFTLEDLKKHLETQFKDGMSWVRFMRGEIHIDHKTPQSKFHYKTADDLEFKNCWNLDNLQPLWAKDNFSKHAKTMEEWNKQKGK